MHVSVIFQVVAMDYPESIICWNKECAEEIDQNKNGLFPKFCSECGSKVIIPVKAPVLEVLHCPKCGKDRGRNKKGALSKFCVECAYNFSEGKLLRMITVGALHSGKSH